MGSRVEDKESFATRDAGYLRWVFLPSQPLKAIDFARLYGKFENEIYSNLTPVVPSFPAREPAAEYQFRIQKEKFQRENLLGFTTRELANLDVISDRQLKGGNLRNCILRIMAHDRWEGRPPHPHWGRDIFYPVKNGQGFWTVDNPDVWRILEPCIRLASRYVMSMHCLHWFCSLINGERRPIGKDRFPLGEFTDDLSSYHASAMTNPDAAAVVRDQMLENLRLKWDLRWYFLDPNELPWGKPINPPGSVSGICTANEDEMVSTQGQAGWRIGLFLSTLNLELLLRNDLTPANRLCLEWDIANTIVHELMHAIQIPLSIGELSKRNEPYFELNPLAEIGFNYESEVLGALTSNIFRKDFDSLPLGFWLEKQYPTFENIGIQYPNTKILVNPGPCDHAIKYPVPVTFYQDTQQEDFWEVGIRAFGFPLLYYRSVREGVRLNFNNHYNYITRGHVWSHTGQPTRVPGFHPFPNAAASFQAKLQQLDMALNKTPYQRAAKAFGEDIIKSVQEGHAFWDNATSQEKRMNMVQTLATRPPVDDDDQRGMLTQVTTLLAEATYFHGNMATSVLYLEQGSGIAYNDRRQGLLQWNRGFRGFMRDLLGSCDPNAYPDIVSTWQAIVNTLEACRMGLWSPISGPEGDDSREYASILYIKHKSEGCKDMCTAMAHDIRTSLFAGCCARITLCALEPENLEFWEVKRDRLNEQIKLLEKLRGYNIKNWLGPIYEWGNLAVQTRNALLDLQQRTQMLQNNPLLTAPPPAAGNIAGFGTAPLAQEICNKMEEAIISKLQQLQAPSPNNDNNDQRVHEGNGGYIINNSGQQNTSADGGAVDSDDDDTESNPGQQRLERYDADDEDDPAWTAVEEGPFIPPGLAEQMEKEVREELEKEWQDAENAKRQRKRRVEQQGENEDEDQDVIMEGGVESERPH